MSNVLIVADGEHSALGASSAKRWLNCPGSVRATKDVPDEHSLFAASGTASHHLSDICRQYNVHPKKYLGWKIAVRRGAREDLFDVDQARVDSVAFFIEYVNELPGRQFFESRVSYEEYVPGGFGTMDHASVTDDTCHIVDFKDGQGVRVGAKKNTQLMLYALGFWLEYSWLYPNLKRFVLHIVQPRLDDPTDEWELSKEELLEWARTVARPGAARTKQPNAPLVAGDWCRENFCRIRRKCQVRAQHIMSSVVQSDFTNLDEAIEQTANLSTLLMDNDQIARLLESKANVLGFYKDLQAHVMSELQKGNACGDWKLVEGRSNRIWTIKEDVVAARLLREGMGEDEIWSKKLVSPSKVEDALGKKHALVNYVKKPKGKPTLAPLSDKRDAMKITELREFDSLDFDDEE